MPAETMIDHVRRAVEGFRTGGDADLRTARRRTLRLLELEDSAFDRRHYEPGHITASGLVLSPDRRHVLLVYHRRLGRWLQPGGHVEMSDAHVAAAAMREVFEETGVVTRHDEEPEVVGVNVHEIPASGGEPAHLHHDVVWRFVAANVQLGSTREHQRTVWCGIRELDRYQADASVQRSLQRALRTARIA